MAPPLPAGGISRGVLSRRLRAPSWLGISASYRAVLFTVMVYLFLSMSHDRPPVWTVLCLTQRDGRSSQTLELEPATSRFLTLSCCFIDNLVARSQLAL